MFYSPPSLSNMPSSLKMMKMHMGSAGTPSYDEQNKYMIWKECCSKLYKQPSTTGICNISFHLWSIIYTNILSPIRSQHYDYQVQCSNNLLQYNKCLQYYNQI